eukprot:CAMPEP_0198148518 /NCGR_PEP_ID=MMETSP1443-20131203/41732_1 /TAXON_ID=186043 /ORGANISM="Entomoneis sp., Strain CCMP2396" /LENGTH=263 /DNA_ID=CAMNT_0043813215 /DNA_START=410 /DNA_END=1201 /DNA_ORIENTATION=+
MNEGPRQRRRRHDKGDTSKVTTAAMSASENEPNNKENDNGNADNDNDGDSNMNPIVALIGGTTSAVVAAIFYAVLAWKRDGIMVAFFLGSIANAVMSKVLKKLIAQTRPEGLDLSTKVRLKPSDGGMPSSHAMSLGFIGTFTILNLAPATAYGWCVSIPIVAFSMTSLIYRVQVKLHTWEQVVVGLIFGSSNAYLFQTFAEQDLIAWLQSHYILNNQGLLPLPLLIVPAVVGALIVGSVERRLSNWTNRRKKEGANASGSSSL